MRDSRNARFMRCYSILSSCDWYETAQKQLIFALVNHPKREDERRMKFSNVTVHAKANVYFEGRVISHTIMMPSGEHKTVGVILLGSYHFGTKLAERMEIIEGQCEILLDGNHQIFKYAAGESFEISANSGFTITVNSEPCHYICSFLA